MKQVDMFDKSHAEQTAKREPFAEVPDVNIKGSVIEWPEDSVARVGDRISVISWSDHVANCAIVRAHADAVTVQWALGVQATVSLRTCHGLGAIKKWRINGDTKRAIRRGVVSREKER